MDIGKVLSWFRLAMEWALHNWDFFEGVLFRVVPEAEGDAEISDALAELKQDQSPERYAALKEAVEAKGGDMEKVERELFNEATVQV